MASDGETHYQTLIMKESLRYLLWVFTATVWTTLCFITPDFIDSPFEGVYGLLLVCGFIVLCGIGSFFLLYIIGCNKYVTAVVLPLWAVTGAALSYYRVGYHVTLTPMLIDATLHTNIEEAAGVIAWEAVVWTIMQLVIAVLFIRWRWRRIHVPHAWIHCLAACLVLCIYFNGNRRLRSSLRQRFPYTVSYTIREYISLQHDIASERRIPDFTVTEQPDSLSIVLILGEAVRADHLQLNGYERETTPLLQARDNVITLPHIRTEQTHTLASLPVILTRADSAHEDYQYTETSFITVFRQAGYRTAWISNQDLGRTFTHFIAESDTAIFPNAGKSVYVFSRWLDEELIPLMNSAFVPCPPRTLYVLHAIGSHWDYNTHVPADMYHFLPLTSNRTIAANSIEQVVNSYDNTIRYMDYFVDSVIATLVDKKALVIYQSDHGESLGENNKFLHGNDEECCKQPACIVWYSDSFAEAYPDKIKALVANKDKRYHTDYVFYSILYAAGIEAEGDCPEANIFR